MASLFFKRAMSTKHSYKDAIGILNDLQTNHSVLNSTAPAISATQSLPQMREWLRRAGYDDMKAFDKLNIIHVTGTKGKGSTCAFLQSVLKQHLNKQGGIKKIGLYTSPHLKTVRERIRINGEPLSKEKFIQYAFEVRDKIESTESDLTQFPDFGPGAKPNYFRFMTILSFHVFLRENVDAAIYEVGIGGEYDSTNVFDSPVATGVGSLGIDHTRLLGDTIDSIAWNKGGIYKSTATALSVEQPHGGLEVLKQRAAERQAPFKEVKVHPEIGQIKLGLPASFQMINATLAVHLAANYLSKMGIADIEIVDDKPLPREFVKGLEEASWPGRCQIVSDDKITWYLDGAHTVESLVEAGRWFGDRSKDNNTKRILVFNQQNKDHRNVEELLHTLHKQVTARGIQFDLAIFTTNVTWSSGYSAELASYAGGDSVDKLEVQNIFAKEWAELDGTNSQSKVTKNIQDAVEYVRGLNEQVDVLVTGSLHLVGGWLTVLEGEDDE